jgi:hypothetical protein
MPDKLTESRVVRQNNTFFLHYFIYTYILSPDSFFITFHVYTDALLVPSPEPLRRRNHMSGNKTRRIFLQSLSATGIVAGTMSADNTFAAVDAPVRSSNMRPAGDRYINPYKVLLYECTRREIRERLASGDLRAAIVPTGSTEQHNEHMAMIMDTAGALLISQQAALKLYPRVIVTTPVAIGVSPHWMNRKGTLTLRTEIFQEIVYDICDSLKTRGIKTILIVNGHGGNVKPLNEKIDEYRSKLGITIDAGGSGKRICRMRQCALACIGIRNIHCPRCFPGTDTVPGSGS